jgi:hypothetical protein
LQVGKQKAGIDNKKSKEEIGSRGLGIVRAHGFGGPRREQSPENGMLTHAIFLTHGKDCRLSAENCKTRRSLQQAAPSRFPTHFGKEQKER